MSERKSCLIIAGEKSGEEHALSFFPDLVHKNPNVDFFGVGGDELQAANLELIYHLKDFSSWGLAEVIHKIPFYLGASKKLLTEVKKRKCKTAILIDFQDFNLRLCRKLKAEGVDVLYYVAPQAWAWRAYRARILEKNVHTLFTILPFEKKWFKERGVTKIKAVEHPLLRSTRYDIEKLPSKTFDELKLRPLHIVLLPGSRNNEVFLLLPEFLNAINILKKEFKLVVHLVKTTSVREVNYQYYQEQIDYIYPSSELNGVLRKCDIAIAASGTVTLSTALFELPTVVCYKGSLITEFIFNQFIAYKGAVSLANIVHQEKVFPELLQLKATGPLIANSVREWLTVREEYEKIKSKLRRTKSLLSGDDFNLSDYITKVIDEGNVLNEV